MLNVKEINLQDSVFQIVTQYPEVKDIMINLGFSAIAKPGMLQSAGRYVTLSKGAKMKKIPWTQVEDAFVEQGFTFKGVVE